MNITEFVNFCETLNKGTFTQISVITSPKMRKTNNPYYGRVKKLSTYVGEFFDYQKKMTKENPDYSPTRPNRCFNSWLIPDVLGYNTETECAYLVTKRYLKGHHTQVWYYLDNRLVTDKNVINEIKSFFSASKPKNESDFIYNAIHIENVIGIKQGEKVYSRVLAPVTASV